jgi:3-hydroxy-9,10-secoandrosta-1,3,5(10)-triene-9,17-dione monooxygenase
MLTSEGDGQPAEARLFLIPRSDYSIIDTWRVIGLRGTGSNDLFAEKIFVPAHRAIASTPGLLPLVSRTDLAPLYRLPWLYVFTSTISAIGIGMGRGALRAFMEMVCSRPGDATHGGKDDPRIRDLLGRTISELDMIEALVQRNFGDFVSAIQERREMPIGEALRSRSQLASILRRIAGLVDEMMLLSGARGIREESPLRRFWLDLCAARAHAGNDPTATLSRLADVCSAVI